MGQQRLNFDGIGQLDGGAGRAIIDAAIQDAIVDLDDRGEDGKPRKVVIVLDLCRTDRGLVKASVAAAAQLPKRSTAAHITCLKRDSGKTQLVFSEFAPEDPEQLTLDQAQEQA